MIIVIAGIKRSGSTAQYNMVRLVCEKYFKNVHVTGDPTDIKGDCTIVKIHTFDSELYRKAHYVFTTDRDRKEVKKSLDRFNRGDRKTMVKMNEHLRKWKTKSMHMGFKAICQDPKKCIELIAEHLNAGVDSNEILKEFESIKPPTDKDYDPRTMLFSNHITKK